MKLTRTERDLLKFFEENADRTLTRTDIVKGVWDEEYFGLTNVVDVHVHGLRTKGVKIETVRMIGYRYGKEEPQPEPSRASSTQSG